jgi:hypothetical protein
MTRQRADIAIALLAVTAIVANAVALAFTVVQR